MPSVDKQFGAPSQLPIFLSQRLTCQNQFTLQGSQKIQGLFRPYKFLLSHHSNVRIRSQKTVCKYFVQCTASPFSSTSSAALVYGCLGFFKPGSCAEKCCSCGCQGIYLYIYIWYDMIIIALDSCIYWLTYLFIYLYKQMQLMQWSSVI